MKFDDFKQLDDDSDFCGIGNRSEGLTILNTNTKNKNTDLKENLKLRPYESIVLQKYQNKNLRSTFLNSYKDLGMVLFL